MFTECSHGVTSPRGYIAAGVNCGIKKRRKDIALIYSKAPAVAAAIFTTNKVPAAPVIVDRIQLKSSPTKRAVVINSGNANACTGERGLNDAWTMVKCCARVLEIEEHEMLVSSTGIIGQYLPMEMIESGIADAAFMLDEDGHTAAAEAIMTTDKFPKECAIKIKLDDVEVTIGGMAKGSGMIAPNMATMLAFITTDANITAQLLQSSLKRAADHSFNRITVDGDTSTNDMVIVLANGLARNRMLTSEDDPAYRIFYDALEYLLVKLSKMIVMDGEGATKFIEIRVTGAPMESSAVQAAKSIANSNLVKTAIHGEDANWGRILAAVGYSGIDFEPEAVEIFFDDIPILRQHYAIDFSERRAKEILRQKEIRITVNLNQGTASASVWTCDLSQQYVAINANYRT
ncbi:MAG: bifunctional glutamate N-acetyltransferase/amino-acid acetyltransferase ArgJ [Acidobacteriota bacterium]